MVTVCELCFSLSSGLGFGAEPNLEIAELPGHGDPGEVWWSTALRLLPTSLWSSTSRSWSSYVPAEDRARLLCL